MVDSTKVNGVVEKFARKRSPLLMAIIGQVPFVAVLFLLSSMYCSLAKIPLAKSWPAELTAQLDGIELHGKIGGVILAFALAVFYHKYYRPRQEAKAISPDHLAPQVAENGNRAQTITRLPVKFAFFCLAMYTIVLTRCLQFPGSNDDAFMDFRYVYNWVHGLGIDYNSGEPVMGFTSHLHLAVLYLVAIVFRSVDIALLSQLLSTFLQCVCGFLIFVLSEETFGGIWAILPPIAYAIEPFNIHEPSIGKEIALIQVLMCLALFFFARQRWRLFCWSSALLFLARPEGFIWLLLSLGHSRQKLGQTKKWIGAWLPPLAVVAACYFLLFLHFHTIVPHGFLGRTHMFHRGLDYPDHSGFFVVQTVGTDVFGPLVTGWLSPDFNFPIAWILQGLLAFLLFYECAKPIGWLNFYFQCSVGIALFYIILDPWTFPWYYSWFTLISVFLMPLLLKPLIHFAWNSRSLAVKVTSALLAICLLEPNIMTIPLARFTNFDDSALRQYFHSLGPVFQLSDTHQRLLIYAQAAKILRSSPHKVAIVAAMEPGAFGYNLPGQPVCDLGGLLTDSTLRYYPVPNNQMSTKAVWSSIPVQAIEEIRPDYLLFPDSLADNGLLKNREFLSTYRLCQVWPIKLWGGRGIYAFLRDKPGAKRPPQEKEQRRPALEDRQGKGSSQSSQTSGEQAQRTQAAQP